jgi:hypothetical protein
MALETLWSRVSDAAEPNGFSAIPIDTWLQALALLLAIVVLWIYYAQLVMRLVWVPRLTDSLVPFALGIGQFLQADTLGRSDVASWLAPFPLIFLLCFASWHWTVARALDEPENVLFVSTLIPENSLVRHGPMLGSVAVLSLLSAIVGVWPASATAALVALNLLMMLHLWLQGRYWRDSVESAG